MMLPSDFDMARPSPSSVQPCVAHWRYGAPPFSPTPTSSELWNQPRYWSPPSRYRSAGPGQPVRLASARPGGSSRSRTRRRGCRSPCGTPSPPHFAQRASGAEQLGRGAVVPDVGGVLGEQVHHAVEDLAVGERLAALLAVEDDDAARPRRAGARCTSRAGSRPCSRCAPRPRPESTSLCWMASSAWRAQIVPVHADEPLLGGAEDGRVVAAPAVRVAVVELRPSAEQRAALACRMPTTIGFASQTVLPIISSGRRPAAPSAWKKRPAASTGQ